MNIKKTYRIYNEMGLQLRNKTPKRRVKAKLRDDRKDAVQTNDVWAMDFVHDQLATGRKLRVLTVIDTFSRYVPILDVKFSYRGEDVVNSLERVCVDIGYPKTIRVDNGPQFISRDLDLWAYHKGVVLDFADRRCLHRSLQRQIPSGMSERALVLEPCRCRRKVGDLAWILQ